MAAHTADRGMAAQATDNGYEKAAIKDILNKSSDYLGKGVTIEGKITQECPMRGCWITVDDGTGVLLVDFNPNNFTIPLNQIGNTAKVYGDVTLVGEKKKLTFEPGSPYIIGKKVEITGDIKQPLVSTG
ncbi:MAG TPA: DUF4920 domain-containing protein [Methanotrichaceae archaeon]|nr:DUF4920 domain-containing protein [Methanotrichaceae archaeon]